MQAAASASLSGSTVFSNSAGYGAGIETSGLLTVTDSAIKANHASMRAAGCGIWTVRSRWCAPRFTASVHEKAAASTVMATMSNYHVNIVSNATGTDGGGIYHDGGTFFVTNATISNNYAAGNGGGIYQNWDDNLVLRNVTLSENQAAGFGGGITMWRVLRCSTMSRWPTTLRRWECTLRRK